MRDRVVIDKLAKGVSKNGYSFEQEICQQVCSGKLKDESLGKLFIGKDPDLVTYYKWRAFSYYNCDSKRTWSQLPYQMCSNGTIFVPPRNTEDSQRLNPAKYIKQRVIREQRLMRVNSSFGANQVEEGEEAARLLDWDGQE